MYYIDALRHPLNEPRHEKTCFCHMRTTKMQIRLRGFVFIIRCLDSILLPFYIPEISSLLLVAVAAQAGFSLTWSQIPKTGFLVTRLNLIANKRIHSVRIVCVCVFRFNVASTIFQSYHDGGWLRQGAQCSLL